LWFISQYLFFTPTPPRHTHKTPPASQTESENQVHQALITSFL
jgi:hypothetical protein